MMDKRNRHTTTAGLKALGLVIVIGLLGCHKQEQQPQGPPDPTVKGETVIFADNAPKRSPSSSSPPIRARWRSRTCRADFTGAMIQPSVSSPRSPDV